MIITTAFTAFDAYYTIVSSRSVAPIAGLFVAMADVLEESLADWLKVNATPTETSALVEKRYTR